MAQVETDPIARRTMTIFFLVDTSGSMSGAKIGSVNFAIEEVIPELQDIAKDNIESDLKVAVLKFSTNTEWVNPDEAIEVENFVWEAIPGQLIGLTAMGAAFRELNSKLSRSAFMQQINGSFEPAIILLTDGFPTDEWERGLNELKENKWFTHAIRIAIAIGPDADRVPLEAFTGNSEAIFDAKNPKQLKELIKLIAVTSSMIGSKSRGIGDGKSSEETESKSDEVISTVNERVEELQSEPESSDDWDDGDEF